MEALTFAQGKSKGLAISHIIGPHPGQDVRKQTQCPKSSLVRKFWLHSAGWYCTRHPGFTVSASTRQTPQTNYLRELVGRGRLGGLAEGCGEGVERGRGEGWILVSAEAEATFFMYKILTCHEA